MAQTLDQRDLLNSYRSGDLSAGERIVRVHQNELLRSAFLLTGTAEGAVALARDAFLGFFRRLLRGDIPEDARFGLLQSLGRTYLNDAPDDDAADNGAGSSAALAGAVLYQGEPQRYRVDDERSRVLTTLELLDRPTRLGLVLRDFNMLDEEPVCQILDETPFALRARLHPARNRVQDAGGGSGDHSARELLVTAATSAPRPEVWSEVAGPLEQLRAEEDERKQRYTYAAAAAVGLLLVLAALWLFDVFPFGGNESDVAAVATEAAAPTQTPVPQPTATVPDLSSYAIPQGDVPARMMMAVFGNRDNQGGVNEFGYFDPESGAFSPQDLEWFPTPSPDGRYLVGLVIASQDPQAGPSLLAAHDSETGERLWETELAASAFSFAVTLERVYAVTSFSVNDAEAPLLLEYDLRTGELIAEHPDVISNILADMTTFNSVQLWATPDGERLFIALEEFGSGPTTMLSRTLASFSLPDLTFESASIQTDSTSVRQFPTDFNFFEAKVTPDGEYLYDLGPDVVRFRSAYLERDVDIGLPLGGPPSGQVSTGQPLFGQQGDLRWITSNDGRYLYVIAVSRRQAAVVDLLARRVDRSFALDVAPDVGAVDWDALGTDTPVGFGSGMALSPDGRYLYLTGSIDPDPTDQNTGNSLVLTVDLTTWTVIRRQEILGRVLTVSSIDDRIALSTDVRPNPEGATYRIYYLDPATGEVGGEFSGEGLPEWATDFLAVSLAEFYRYTYARAPAVGGVSPSDVQTASTLPRVRVGARPDAVAEGGTVSLTVRVLHPVTGRFVAEESPDARFDLESTIVLRLSHDAGEAEDIILVANLAEPGVYRASAIIPVTGPWSAEVTLTGADGRGWTLAAPQLFEGVPSWEATDGRRYVLRIETEPAEAPAGQPVTLRARFVEVQSGEPLPVTAELLESFPDELSVSFRSAGLGVSSSRLTRQDSGVYEGTASFSAPGVWDAEIQYARPGEGFVTVGADTVTVGQ